ncbi:hypothetical protein DICPUDRAFT_157447 [Dictyostelium purpureum]|uniref:Cullin-4 n=1 Tax=Dictyostelium purpureum TaxID=5786 RepID=F0ZZ57_DICPU|nr:uncharacterized protein DICPUDRAFT_157447 [Dictyostelium purpureum]EGC30785.1 hypothetical protein DICPUDRAFT_157447 [Dictyostelium purpureum]|eukprot:XP_003292701.1 hypothetical protein DICPUDRAFT_157447 [Dictyostelium purpureum]
MNFGSNSNNKKPLTNSLASTPPAKKILTIKNLKQVPKTPDNYEETSWLKLSSAITSINKKEATQLTQEELYKMVENLCSDKQLAANLYNKISVQLEQHITNTLKHLALNQPTDPVLFLKSMNSVWRDHTSQMIMIRSIFLYLDRTYVIQTQNVKSIWDLGLFYFGNTLKSLSQLLNKTNQSLLLSITNERKGDEIDRDLMHSLIKMLSALHIYSLFEKEFIKETDRFYQSEGQVKVFENEIPVYLKHISNRLTQEGERLIRYLDQGTKKQLISVLEKQLIEKHVDIILSKGFKSMVEESRIEDLNRLYVLLNGINEVGKLKQSWSNYIKTTGQQMVQDSEKEQTLIQDLLEFKDRLDKILEQSFLKNDTLTYSLKESFEYFINTRQNKPAELIARFIDSKLKIGGKRMSEEELEIVLNKSLILFRYIQGKDVFEAFYKQDLSKRLLLDKSISIDSEKSMIQKLKTECGTTFTAKLEAMFKDIELSNDIMNAFKDSPFIQNYKSIEMNIYVLTHGNWPFQQPIDAILPKEFIEYQEVFNRFYLSKHSGKTLKWQNALSYCVLKAHFPSAKKEISVSLFQTIILYLFNDYDEISFKDIQVNTGLPVDELKKNLLSLSSSKSEILVKKSSSSTKSKSIDENDSFAFNTKFTHKLFKIKVNSIQTQETVEENKKTNEVIIADRQYQVDAAIVRIMKTRKTLNHNLLISELIGLLKFQPKPTDLKKRIEVLIEKEYLCRDPENPMIYNYMA